MRLIPFLTIWIALNLTGCASIPQPRIVSPGKLHGLPIPACPSLPTEDKVHPDNVDSLPEAGAGPHGLFRILRDPATQKPLGNTAYFMRIEHTGFGGECELIAFFDVTDEAGRSAFVRTRKAVFPKDVTLVRRIGDGEWGDMVQLVYDEKQAATYREYRMTACDGKTFSGISNEQGRTVYFSHPDKNCKIRLQIINHDSE